MPGMPLMAGRSMSVASGVPLRAGMLPQGLVRMNMGPPNGMQQMPMRGGFRGRGMP